MFLPNDKVRHTFISTSELQLLKLFSNKESLSVAFTIAESEAARSKDDGRE